MDEELKRQDDVKLQLEKNLVAAQFTTLWAQS
jgi:hypothetical protein